MLERPIRGPRSPVRSGLAAPRGCYGAGDGLSGSPGLGTGLEKAHSEHGRRPDDADAQQLLGTHMGVSRLC